MKVESSLAKLVNVEVWYRLHWYRLMVKARTIKKVKEGVTGWRFTVTVIKIEALRAIMVKIKVNHNQFYLVCSSSSESEL